MHQEYRKTRNWLFVGLTGMLFLGSLSGAGIAYSIGPRQNVIKETHTIKQIIREKVEVPQGSCSDGRVGQIVKIHSEQVSTATKDEPDTWTYGNIVTLDMGNETIVCYFQGAKDLTKVLDVGMKFAPAGGERI